jgi:hypothetical protein
MHMYEEDVFHLLIIHLKTFNIQQFYDGICYISFTSRLHKVISFSTLLCASTHQGNARIHNRGLDIVTSMMGIA